MEGITRQRITILPLGQTYHIQDADCIGGGSAVCLIDRKIGYGVVKGKKNYAPHKHQNSFTYIVKYNEAINILELVEPYLVITQKKLRAEMIISQYKLMTTRNGKYTIEQKNLKQHFYEEFMTL